MRFNELLVEDKQLDELSVGKAITGVAKGVGKAIGGVAKGVGAVAGGIAGIPGAIKKGFQAGKATVAGDNAQPASGTTKSTTAPSIAASGTSNTGAATSAAAPTSSSTSAATSTAAPTPSTTSTAAPTPAQSTTTAASSQPAATTNTGAEQQPAASADAVTNLQNRILKLDTDNQREILKLLQTQAAKKPAAATVPPAPAANTAKPAADTPAPANDQAKDTGIGSQAFGKMAQDLAGGAQKDNDAKSQQQTNQPAPQPNSAETPAPTAGNTAQQDLKAKLQAKQGLAKTSGTGFKQGLAKGNMRLGAGRGGVTMSHVPQGKMIGEVFSLFRKH